MSHPSSSYRTSDAELKSDPPDRAEAALHLSQSLPVADSQLDHPSRYLELFDLASRLDARTKQALCQLLLTQLNTDQVREAVDFGKSELATREGKISSRKPQERCTRLVLKKDYSFQKLNLADPTQYFVYLVRRKPKLDRYIGTLFYIPEGFPLSYFPDAEGRIVFTAPNNLFKLSDSQSAQSQVVRLVSIDPPPPEYTFEKGQEDVPELYLRLDYLNPVTYELKASERYPYPACMYEGGKLDRYRWSVAPLVLSPDAQSKLQAMSLESGQSGQALQIDQTELLPATQRRESLSVSSQTSQTITQLTELADHRAIAASPAPAPGSPSPRPKKFILTDLPKANTATYYLFNPEQGKAVLERLWLYAALSELAIPQAKWVIEQNPDRQTVYQLVNSKSKRLIVQFSLEDSAITLQNSFPVITTGFRDLARSASQMQNDPRITREQRTFMHKLHVEMGLPQQNPLEILEKLFGVKFQDAPVNPAENR